MKYFYLLFFLLPFHSTAQDYPLLSAEGRAYLYHIVKKSPILDNNLGRFFDYKGPDVKFLNGEIHFDSIEEIIINQPEMLIIRSEEIAKSPVGLIAEAANKMAIWELNKALIESRKNDSAENNHFLNEYRVFENHMIGHLPASAFKSKGDTLILHPKLEQVFNPSLSLDDKKAMLQSFRQINQEEALQILQALNYATNAYVEQRAFEIYLALGGKARLFTNILVAAGDGSNTTGLLEEREKDEKGRWNKGLPKAVGLFPYQLRLEEKTVGKKRKVVEIEPDRSTVNDFFTAGNNRLTNVHFDVWGYNAQKQTTVIVEKSGKTYRLYGSGETRFLSPDSSFAGSGTYQTVIDELEFKKIGDLKEMIYGKKGFDYWIAYNEKKRDETELKIEKTSKKQSDFGYTSITTSKKVSRKVKKDRKKSKVLKDYQPTTDANKKKKTTGQNEVIYLYQKFEAYKTKIKELELQKEEAIELMTTYEIRLDNLKRNFGYNPMPFSENEGLYTFSDSTTFDMNTQEFVFPATKDTVPFEVRLLAIPNSSLSDEADEVMLHINIIDAAPRYNARLQLKLEDSFASDEFSLDKSLLQAKDSVAMQLFFEGLLNKKVDFEIIARGNGMGEWNGTHVVKSFGASEEQSYPGKTDEEKLRSKMDSSYAQLRLSEVFIDLGRSILLEINSYTDPVVSNLKITEPNLQAQMTKNNWTKNEMLSALRTYTLLKKLKEEVNVLAGTYLSRTDAKIVIDRFNKEIMKTKISVGSNSLKVEW